ncbi:MAG: hypothetical protein LW700_06340 [Gemmataceae bacterium]|nr:hypothetical protein [Gemmataceae bacterium]
MTDNGAVLKALTAAHVEFILIGGLAAIVHGSARVTYDIDVLYNREADNLGRLASSLAPFFPYPRGAPKGLPFEWSKNKLQHGCNFTLVTTLGDIDLLGLVPGNGTYETILPNSQPITLAGSTFPVVSLSDLIHLKTAAGRPKDLEALAELEILMRQKK